MALSNSSFFTSGLFGKGPFEILQTAEKFTFANVSKQGETATKQRKQVQQSQAIYNPLPSKNKLPNDIQIPSKVVW